MREGISAPVEFGAGGMVLGPGDHVCALYRGSAGRDEILIPYLADGLRVGDRCVCFLERADRAGLIDQLSHFVQSDSTMADKLDVLDFSETYLRNGRFSVDEWFEFLDRRLSCANGAESPPVARGAGEMTWSLQSDCPGVDGLCSYEAMVNRFRPHCSQILLCLYDVERFSGEVLIDALRTHPKVIAGNLLIDNPYYLEPEELFADSLVRG